MVAYFSQDQPIVSRISDLGLLVTIVYTRIPPNSETLRLDKGPGYDRQTMVCFNGTQESHASSNRCLAVCPVDNAP